MRLAATPAVYPLKNYFQKFVQVTVFDGLTVTLTLTLTLILTLTPLDKLNLTLTIIFFFLHETRSYPRRLPAEKLFSKIRP